MASSQFNFSLAHTDTGSSARRGQLQTPRGNIETPAFMPVGTVGTVKGLSAKQVQATGADILLGNTYHLALRPGEKVVQEMGGLHKFMNWDRPILTDSGGFQVFSLAKMTKITETGATFRSHIDGSKLELTPERSMQIQADLGSDIAMVLDHVCPLPASPTEVAEACDRTTRWAERSLKAAPGGKQAVFGIVQGGLDESLRQKSATDLMSLDFDGYAVGGLSVGEEPSEMYRIIAATCPHLPAERPRYLMGVGRPIDLLEGIARGIDMFDCVMPTRNGRNALAFTDEGPLRMRNLKHQLDPQPLEANCDCLACEHSRGYIRHLFQAGEMLGPVLVSIHNLTYYQRLMTEARQAIEADSYPAFVEEKKRGWNEPTN